MSFRSVINLYVAMRRLGADHITPAEIRDVFAQAQSEPSFFGHPYTCDGHQLDGYPAMCSPQQTLGRWQDGALQPVTDWLDVGAFAR